MLAAGRFSFRRPVDDPGSERAPKGPFCCSDAEALERSLDEAWQRLEVVAAFEHSGDTRRETRAAARELAEAVGRDPHLGERLVEMGVEARRDEHELGVECAHSGLDQL